MDPAILATAARFLQAQGADTIDFNLGCPQRKIRKKGWGSALLDRPENLAKILKAMRSAITCPLSIKIRLSGDMQKNMSILSIATQEGCDWISIHARTWQEHYEVSPRYHEMIELLSQATIPIFVNGNIMDQGSMHAWLDAMPCQGLMIGRGTIGAPWLIRQLYEPMTVTEEMVSEAFACHLSYLLESYHPNTVLLKMRALLPHYLKHIKHPCSVERFYQLERIEDCLDLIAQRGMLEAP
jgi:tRNA-dihydrouridine synthase B